MESISIGNKAENLQKLKSGGFLVPEFIIVPIGLDELELQTRIKASMLRRNQWFAVRSSSIAEDSKTDSKAGSFYTAIAVQAVKVFSAYKKVEQSLNQTKGAIILQQFIPTIQAGVLFTNNGKGQIIINALKGLCKPVVEGAMCDEWYFSSDGKILTQHIQSKKQGLFFENNTLINRAFSKPSLKTKQLTQLYNLAKQLTAFYQLPQDVEWGFYRNKLYVLQSRPITRNMPEFKELNYFDSANIAESYSGLVQPLTLSFAEFIYREVYYNLIKSSGVRPNKLKKYNWVFENMVASFYGRLYYNMNNWYRMTSFIPGYKRNKKNLEQMITSNIRQEVDNNIRPAIPLKIAYPFIVFAKMLFFNRTQHLFKHKTQAFIRRVRQLNFEELTAKDCQKLFDQLNQKLISKWHIPVENDFMVMTYFGLLKKRFNDAELSRIIRFKSKTTQQVQTLGKLSRSITSDCDLNKLLSQNHFDVLNLAINSKPEIQAIINTYFEEFGGRFANELKLESADIEEDYFKFYHLIKLYGNLELNQKNETDSAINESAINTWLINKFRKYAARREEMRLLRSNGFSLVRRLFNQLGSIYAKRELLAAESDIFFLKLDEVFATHLNFKELVAKRKIAYAGYEKMHPPAFFSITDEELPTSVCSNKNITRLMSGRGCALGTIKGKVRIMKHYEMPEIIDFDILVTYHTDPGWTPLLGLVKGLVVEHGGVLSHAAIVARELGIPTIVGVANVVESIETGQFISIDGDKGLIEILD